jgi:hypothetical protein
MPLFINNVKQNDPNLPYQMGGDQSVKTSRSLDAGAIHLTTCLSDQPLAGAENDLQKNCKNVMNGMADPIRVYMIK